jgi:hypothetical protein
MLLHRNTSPQYPSKVAPLTYSLYASGTH